MGRHARRDADATPSPDARLLEGLPGWGLFATAVGAGFIGWTDPRWPAMIALVALGLSSTGILWWTVRRGERGRRRRPEGHDDIAVTRPWGRCSGEERPPA
jgi:hypothetical protein